jgi:hypothetical protein
MSLFIQEVTENIEEEVIEQKNTFHNKFNK